MVFHHLIGVQNIGTDLAAPFCFGVFTSQDSALLTVLPTTGTYYVKVSEFCLSWPQGPMGVDCYADLDVPDYTIGVYTLPNLTAAEAAEVEPNDTQGQASAWPFNVASAGNYYATVAHGDFAQAGNVDVYQFTPPGDG